MATPEQLPTPTDFRTLFESAPDSYLVLTPGLVIVGVSDAYLGNTLTRREQILGRHLFEVFPDNPDDPRATGVSNLRASLERAIKHGVPDTMAVQKYDIRRPESAGGGFEERYWSPVNSPVFAADGSLAYLIHRVEDVTDFIRLKQAGREQSRMTEELAAKAAGLEAEIYLRAQEVQEANAQVRQLNDELERRVEQRTAELRRAEEKLLHAQKLEAVARLTGGIAHDFNNMLAVIIAYADLLLEELPIELHAGQDLRQIKAAGERAAGLTRQLLAFSRQQVVQPKVLDLNAVVAGMETMMRRLIGEEIELCTRLEPALGCVRVDPSQIDQVIANLVVNARDAMPRGGTLKLETHNVELGPNYEHDMIGVAPGAYVLLAVTDSGVGMDEHTKARIFEPFFTTKERGAGTGLGLSTVHGIVVQASGHVWVYSEPGHGTCFKIYLPRVACSEHEVAAPLPTARKAVRDATVLVVEDEVLVRESIIAVLRRAGYRVLEAKNGTDALRVEAQFEGEIDVVMTDLIMPGMNGRELAAQIRRRRPGVRVLHMSGYTDHTLDSAELGADTVFLQKPFVPSLLLETLRTMLASPTAG